LSVGENEKTSNQLAVHAARRYAEAGPGRLEGGNRVVGVDHRHARHRAGRGSLPHGIDDPTRVPRGATLLSLRQRARTWIMSYGQLAARSAHAKPTRKEWKLYALTRFSGMFVRSSCTR